MGKASAEVEVANSYGGPLRRASTFFEAYITARAEEGM